MPEFLVFGKVLVFGVLLAEICQICFRGSRGFGTELETSWGPRGALAGVAVCLALMLTYVHRRLAFAHVGRIASSKRVDLLAIFILGLWIDSLIEPQLTSLHDAAAHINKAWSPTALISLLILLSSPLVRELALRYAKDDPQVTFLSDVEIESVEEDTLSVAQQAKNFAETVLASGGHSGLVFGVDAPWGVGKTSFLNLSQKRWSEDKSVIVVKFEPLRYASEPDLAERFVRDLSAAIRQQIFAPEFAPAATRYSRMLKGKTDLSFFGVKLTLEPSSETIDELLEDIDVVLKQLRRRLIVIVDDLDRLEPKLINNVLFTVRRTFNLSCATYILCFDTEMLVSGSDEGKRAREFLEKFITVKLSLFIDPAMIKRFLKTDWHREANRFQTIPADAMIKLSEVLQEVAAMVSGPKAQYYAPLLGDLRKVKRLVNTMLMLRLEQISLDRTDFHNVDLVHLILLHLHYPGIFRQIYVAETEDRSGAFSLRYSKESATANLENGEALAKVLEASDEAAQFLLNELFDIKTVGFSNFNQPDESARRARACFNSESRALESYLKFIVRFDVPLAVETFKFYKSAFDEVLAGKASVSEVLSRDEFLLDHGDEAHDQFWRILVNNSYRLDAAAADDAINTLVASLPKYSSHRREDRGLRHRLIYTLVLLLDRAGFGAPQGERVRSQTDVVEIAERIFGQAGKFSTSIIDQLVAPSRGVLGWNDLMMLRLTCSIDRGAPVHNIYTALLRFEDPTTNVSGQVDLLAIESMRRFSQQVFRRFKRDFIESERNFLAEVNALSEADVCGTASQMTSDDESDMDQALDALRWTVKAFVIFQLTNNLAPNGTGIGCGYYDESGSSDCGGIKNLMQDYLFDNCFNPELDAGNATEFGDFCLRATRDSSADGQDGGHANALEAGLTKLFDRERLQAFWTDHGSALKGHLESNYRTLNLYNQTWSYSDILPKVFELLDRWTTQNPDEQPEQD